MKKDTTWYSWSVDFLKTGSCAVILNANNVPVGVGFITQWRAPELSAKFLLGYFNQVDSVEFTEEDVDAIIAHAEARLHLNP